MPVFSIAVYSTYSAFAVYIFRNCFHNLAVLGDLAVVCSAQLPVDLSVLAVSAEARLHWLAAQ